MSTCVNHCKHDPSEVVNGVCKATCYVTRCDSEDSARRRHANSNTYPCNHVCTFSEPVKKLISQHEAEGIWKILVDRAGASDSWLVREQFVNYAIRHSEIQEYRFMGHLGMGGKVRIRPEKWEVYCYPEDMNNLRRTLIDNTNYDLAEFKKESEEE